jgi:hypothetical protein
MTTIAPSPVLDNADAPLLTCDACGAHDGGVNRISRWLGGHAWVWRYECQDTLACALRRLARQFPGAEVRA